MRACVNTYVTRIRVGTDINLERFRRISWRGCKERKRDQGTDRQWQPISQKATRENKILTYFPFIYASVHDFMVDYTYRASSSKAQYYPAVTSVIRCQPAKNTIEKRFQSHYCLYALFSPEEKLARSSELFFAIIALVTFRVYAPIMRPRVWHVRYIREIIVCRWAEVFFSSCRQKARVFLDTAV